MDILSLLLSFTVSRLILLMFSRIIPPLKQTILEKINKEIEIDEKGEPPIFFTETSYPAAWLRFKVISKSEIDLYPKHIIAWVIKSGAVIDKISWWRQEKIFEKECSSDLTAYTGGTTYHSIPELPSKENRYFGLYYPLLPHVDFGRKRVGLHGVIEFDCSFGTVVTEFGVGFELSEEKWDEALNKWKPS